MATPPDEEDRFLQERQFGIGSGIDVSDILSEVADSFKETPQSKTTEEKPEEDYPDPTKGWDLATTDFTLPEE